MTGPTRRGTPIVLSAPSGAGKTTLCHRVRQTLPHLAFSVSHTTRLARAGELSGRDYHFVDEAEFERLADGGHFLEWAHVHRRRYGTSRAATEALLAAGDDVLFDIDVQGGRQIANALPEAVLVLVLPPSLDVLAERLRKRHADADEEIEKRLQVAASEIRAADFYTHIIVNESLAEATRALESVILAERVRARGRSSLVEQVLTRAGPARPL
jgi:guanylate kinase